MNLIIGAQIDAANHGGGAVDDQDLAVVAVVGRGPGGDLEGIDRIEINDIEPTGFEAIEKRRRGGVGAIAVIDDVDLHPLSALGKKQVAKVLATALDILDDVV